MYLFFKHRSPRQNLALSYGTHLRNLKCIKSSIGNRVNEGILTEHEYNILNNVISHAIFRLGEDYEKAKARIKEWEDSSN